MPEAAEISTQKEPRRPRLLARMWRYRAFKVLCSLSLAFLLMESGLRIVYAVKVGPSVLLYGTGLMRLEAHGAVDGLGAQRQHLEAIEDVAYHENQGANYTKYHPNQIRYDTDPERRRFRVTINKHGFRGRDSKRAKRSGTLRVVTLGASSTFGYHNREDETYPHYLEVLLRERRRDLPGYRDVEVINLGIPHLTSDQNLSLLVAEGLPLAPDVVTFYEGANDCTRHPDAVNTVKDAIKRRPLLRNVVYFFRDRLLTLALIQNWLHPNLQSFARADVDSQSEGKSEFLIGNLEKMRQACANRGALFVLVSQQAQSYLLESLEGVTYEREARMVEKKLARQSIKSYEMYFLVHRELMRAVENWAATSRVPFVDGIGSLDRDRRELTSWVHLSPKGNRILAAAIARVVVRELQTKKPETQKRRR